MQGVYVKGRRPASKKAVKDALKEFGPESIRLEATSHFGNEFDGSLDAMPDGKALFVGPDPYTSRKFYGTIIKKGGVIKIT